MVLHLPIGVFDSGVGGLTVLRGLRAAMPQEDFLYLGDTARLPYGTKTPNTVVHYAEQCAALLVGRGVKALVVACNTVSAVALGRLSARFAPLPVLGVVLPGASAAVRATRSGHIAVVGTEGTIRGRAYTRAIQALSASATVTGLACPIFVALAEEGWTDGPVARAAAHAYLDPLRAMAQPPDTLVLGCTHFPVLAPMLAEVLGPEVALVDSAATTAAEATGRFEALEILRRPGGRGRTVFLATEGPERFARVGSVFLGETLLPAAVELVDLPRAEGSHHPS
jgi:glutamate racemase